MRKPTSDDAAIAQRARGQLVLATNAVETIEKLNGKHEVMKDERVKFVYDRQRALIKLLQHVVNG